MREIGHITMVQQRQLGYALRHERAVIRCTEMRRCFIIT
jgi:hypothetical protein